jgi:tRNA threonylcarbamoyladenosine biosynthesis protein TsaB
MLLAIDTATQMMSLALHDEHNLLAEQTWPTHNQHSVELAPAVRALLQHSGVAVTDLTALAVCIGPGTYTGLRIGVALAKGMASARNLPLIGLTTMDILAAAQPQSTGGLVAVAQAGRGRIVAATYQWRKSRWTARGEQQLMDWPTLLASIDGPATISGEIDADGHAALDKAKADGVPITVAASALRLRRAGFLAQEALLQLQTEKMPHPADKVMPVYAQTKDAP